MGRAVAARSGVRLLLLIVAHVFFVDGPAGTGSVGDVLSVAATAVPMVALCWWLPAAAADAWFEYRHEPRFGHRPLPVHRFAVGSLGALAVTMVVVGGAGAGAYTLMAVTPYWWVAAIVGSGGLHAVGRGIQPMLTQLTHRAELLDDEGEHAVVVGELRELAQRLGQTDTTFFRMDSDVAPGLNAVVAAGPVGPRVLISAELLAVDPQLLHHVIGHELAHVMHRHLARTTFALGVLTALGFVALALVVESASVFVPLGLSDGHDPRGLAVLVVIGATIVVLLALPSAFLARAFEREADTTAFRLTGALPLSLLRQLHVTERATLDPTVLERVFATHPNPAERLQRASAVSMLGLASSV